jgi:DNA-binding MarR family transcriptional regulator
VERGDHPARPASQSTRLGPPVGSADTAARRLLEGIQLLVRRFAISERTDTSCCGLTVAQSATLDALRAQGPLRLSTLGRRLGITASTLTRNLARLEEAGLVAREADPDDARAARVRLTAAGRGASAQVDRREEAFAQSILDRLPADRRDAVLAALSDLLLAVREATEGCCPGAFDHLMTDLAASGCGPDAASCGPSACR